MYVTDQAPAGIRPRRPRSRFAWAGLVTLSAVALGACSSDTAAVDSTPASATTAAATGSSSATTAAGADASVASTETSVAASLPSGVAVTGGSQAGELTGAALEELLAGRYEAYWDAFDAARSVPTAEPAKDFPLLRDLSAGTQLDISYENVIDLARTGEAIREPTTPAVAGIDADSEIRVRVDKIDGTVAELSGCVVNDDVRHVVGTDTIVRDSVSTVLSNSTMALTDGVWKLIRSQAVAIDDGVTGCWLTGDSEFPY